jgi:cellulose synthase operon protein C
VRLFNTRLAAVLLVIIAVLSVGVYYLHAYQVLRNAYVFQVEAEKAEQRAAEAAKEKNLAAEHNAYQEAIVNLFWYTRLVPNDVDVLEKLGMLLCEKMHDIKSFGQAYNLFDRVLRLDPERMKVRRRFVDMAMSPAGRSYRTAKEHLEQYLLKEYPKDAALWEQLGACNVEMSEFDTAKANFLKAIELDPKQIGAYARLAVVLRRHFSRDEEADRWMKKLVEVNPKSAGAHHLRGSYLRINGAEDDALKEAQLALQLAPDNRDTLLLASQCYLEKANYPKARECIAKGIKLYPNNVDFYVTMADVELRSGNRDKALEALQQGIKITDRNPQLLWSMANLLVDQNRLKEAEGLVKELRGTQYPRQLVDYLAARIAFRQGNWLAARQGFEAVRGGLSQWPRLVKQTDVWIGQCYGHLGNPDQQLKAFRRALTVDPLYPEARAGITGALANSGNFDEALKEFAQLRNVNTAGMVAIARIVLLQTLRVPPAERNWDRMKIVLDQVEKTSPTNTDVPVLRAEMFVAQDRPAEAEKALRDALQKNPKATNLKAVSIALAERQKNWAQAESMLADWRKTDGDTVELRLAQSQYLARREGKKAIADVRKLADNTGAFTDAQRLQLWDGLMAAAVQLDDIEQAKRLGRQMAEKDPQNVQVRYLLFEQALHAENQADVDWALQEIRRVAGQSEYWHYAQAVRLTMKAKDQKGSSTPVLDEALQHLATAHEQRPTWGRIPLLMAGIYDQQGKPDQALASYEEAIELGERNPIGMRRAVQLLFQKQQYAKADRLLHELERQQVPFSAEMNRASAEAALRQGEYDRALEIARKTTPSDTATYQEYLWQGRMLSVLGHQTKSEGKTDEAKQLLANAEKALRKAVELKPDTASTWVMLIQFLSGEGQVDQAEKLIDEASRKIPAKQAPLAIAECYEAMGKNKEAGEKYESALAAAPQDPAVVRAVADFYCRAKKTAPAETLLRRMIDGKVKVPSADRLWARRELAAIYAAKGGYQNIQKARQLIDENLAGAEPSALDRRVQAGLNAIDPLRSRRNEAVRAMEKMVEDKSATPEDRFKLALLYLNSGGGDDWVKGNNILRDLVATKGDEPRYMVAYISTLLDHGSKSDAETYLKRLEKTHPNDIATVSLRADVLVGDNQPEQALELLKTYIDKPNAQPSEHAVRVRLVAEKLEQLSQRLTKPAQKATAERLRQQAEMLLQAYVDQVNGQEWIMMAFLARQGRNDDALNLLDRSWDGTNPLALSQVISLFLRSNKLSKEQLQRLDQTLQKALKRFDRPVPLLAVMGDLCNREAHYAEAETFYREVLQKNSGSAYAMNNLAVLLALQGVKLEEALKLINQAIEISGPMPAMLDSRASVYLALGEAQKALADMNEAVADADMPVRLFHQAQAYEALGQHSDAVRAMETARRKGLNKDALHPLEIPSFEKLSPTLR